MNYIAVAFAVIIAFFVPFNLISLVEVAMSDPMGWRAFHPTPDLEWWIGGLCIMAATATTGFILEWRRKAVAKARRKQIARRARA